MPRSTVEGLNIIHWTVNVIRRGKIIFLKLNIDGKMDAKNEELILFTLPEIYRPFTMFQINYCTQTEGIPMLLAISPDGTVALFNSNKTVNNWPCRQIISYPASE